MIFVSTFAVSIVLVDESILNPDLLAAKPSLDVDLNFLESTIFDLKSKIQC